jgi:pimeloyl-ACP methyl ester carboxylesterase
MKKHILFLLLIIYVFPAFPQLQPLGTSLEGFEYPYEVKYINFNIEGHDVRMAYMDVKPSGENNGKTVILLHGKNFFGEYWRETIKYLTENGCRVIVPDQLGFGKSSKPVIYYTFQMMAKNTKFLLDSLGIKKVIVVGHSMGGMLASRFALMYPDITAKLVLENPIGLEDYKTKVPYSTLEEYYKKEMSQTEEAIRNYHKKYYVSWKEDYDKYVKVQAGYMLSAQYPQLAWVNALTSQMIYTQPVVYEFPQIKVQTLVIIGQKDRTAIGKDKVNEDIAKTMGNYPELGKKTASAIPGAELVEIENAGHIPHFETPDKFHNELLKFIMK